MINVVTVAFLLICISRKTFCNFIHSLIPGSWLLRGICNKQILLFIYKYAIDFKPASLTGPPGIDGVARDGKHGERGPQGSHGEAGYPGKAGPQGLPGYCEAAMCLAASAYTSPRLQEAGTIKGPSA